MRINNNLMAMNTHRQLGMANTGGAKSMEKLSSGFRINRAGDDAAGLAISEKMRGQIRGLNQASANSQDAISLIQTTEGALNETHAILQRMRELAVQSGNDTNTSEDRVNIQDEIKQLTAEIDRISDTTEFNTKKLLDGSMGKAVDADVANIQTNSSLSGSTLSTTELVNLKDKGGASLGIVSGDTVTVSFMKDGTLTTFDVAVSGGTDLAGLASAGNFGVTSGTGGAVLITASGAGFAGSINGITITVKDKDSNVKTAATNVLSSFSETTSAKNQRLDGSATFQIGANTGQHLVLDIENLGSKSLGVSNLKMENRAQADIAIKVIDQATKKVSAERSKLGATQNRLEHTIKNLDTSSENLQASESRIRDVDMAKEMMEQTKQNILQQASTAMLAQANNQPETVLQLLR